MDPQTYALLLAQQQAPPMGHVPGALTPPMMGAVPRPDLGPGVRMLDNGRIVTPADDRRDAAITTAADLAWSLSPGGAAQSVEEFRQHPTWGGAATLPLDVASFVPAGSLAKAAAPVAAIFAGIGAKTADRAALKTAERLVSEGVGRDEIWKQTGWFKGGDGKWRFEIPDNAAKYNESAVAPREYTIAGESVMGREGPFEKVLHHPDLSAAYPDINGITVSETKYGDRLGQYIAPHAPMPEYINLEFSDPFFAAHGGKKIMLHETQHAVQQREGFARGGFPSRSAEIENPAYAVYRQAQNDPAMREFLTLRDSREYADELRTANAAWNERYQPRIDAMDAADRNLGRRLTGEEIAARDAAFHEMVKEYEATVPTPLQQRLDALGADLRARGIPTREPAKTITGEDAYRQMAGEVEARNVEARMHMTPEERRAKPPWATQDVPDGQQIIRMRDAPGSLAPWGR